MNMTINQYSKIQAKTIVESDPVLKDWADRLRAEDQDSGLDYGTDYFDLCSNVDDESDDRIWIDVYSDDMEQSFIGLSVEQAILIARDIMNQVA